MQIGEDMTLKTRLDALEHAAQSDDVGKTIAMSEAQLCAHFGCACVLDLANLLRRLSNTAPKDMTLQELRAIATIRIESEPQWHLERKHVDS